VRQPRAAVIAAAAAAAAAAALAVAGVLFWTAPSWLIDWLARRAPGCLYRVPTREPLVALTIDDGPDPATTPLVLEQLREHDARATFFLIGSRVTGRELLVRAIVAERHELGNHLMHDRPSIRLPADTFAADLLRTGQILESFAPVRWARPSSGWYTSAMVAAVERMGYRCALGSVYPIDATIPSAAFAARYILRNTRPGAVLVLHDGGGRGRRTARVLAKVLPELRARGYQVVSLGELTAAAALAASATHPPHRPRRPEPTAATPPRLAR
jgi:peptidoglycan/xylan/chitin deacetylase (PgdA/CDA1 family)